MTTKPTVEGLEKGEARRVVVLTWEQADGGVMGVKPWSEEREVWRESLVVEEAKELNGRGRRWKCGT